LKRPVKPEVDSSDRENACKGRVALNMLRYGHRELFKRKVSPRCQSAQEERNLPDKCDGSVNSFIEQPSSQLVPKSFREEREIVS
jgi:hypothetical protein